VSAPAPRRRRIVTAVLALAGLTACGRGGPPTGAPTLSAGGEVAFTALPEGARRDADLDPEAEAAANRELRAQLPQMTGARLVSVIDRYVSVYEGPDGDDQVATGVATTWEYAVDGSTKCGLASVFEVPLGAAGWSINSLETAGVDSASSIRFTRFLRDRSYLTLSVGSPPTRFSLGVESRHGRRAEQLGPPPGGSPFVPCRPDAPSPPANLPDD